ncbi:MAG TPA: glycosyltransferase family 39 protein, partial [bacterium]|nr:glycosyltransferase family 39 protein [bacterium]
MSGASGRAWRAVQQLFRSETWWVWCIAGLKLALNVAFHGRYGYFRDELYYIACSDHLAWGYVDQPPLSVLILAATRWLFGDSLYAIRFVPALAGAGVVVLAGSMARLLGGKKFAQLLAAAAAALSPVILGNAARNFSMNAFDL